MTVFYKIADFRVISPKAELPASIRQIIKHLGDSVAPTDTVVEKRVVAPTQQAKEEWTRVKAPPKLVATRIVVPKEGTEKTIKEIRIALNKFTTKNAEVQQQVIVGLIRQVMTESPNVEEDCQKVVGIIFDIVSSNEFYSALYAKLYKDLMDEFDGFSMKLDDIVENYKQSYNTIVVADPNVDYDGFCASVKSNDKRKAMTRFICNSMKNGVLTNDTLVGIIVYLEELVIQMAKEQGKAGVVEELTENIFILIGECGSHLKSDDRWVAIIVPNIHTISKLRKTDAATNVSMSARATFKYMDILDLLTAAK